MKALKNIIKGVTALALASTVFSGVAFADTKQVTVNECYKMISKAIENHKETISFSGNSLSWETLIQAENKLYKNESDYFLLIDRTNFSYATATFTDARGDYVSQIQLKYNMTKKEFQKVNKKVKAIAKKAKKQKTTAKKIKYIHDYLVKYTAYSTVKSSQYPKRNDGQEHTSYSVIVNHRGVCDGYSKAFMRLCKAAGISSKMSLVIVTSPGSSKKDDHAITKIGKYYYDVTWDDPAMCGKDQGSKIKVSHKYYKKTKKQMQKLGYKF